MHNCDPPPIEELEEWLEDYPSEKDRYGHLLLEQKNDVSEELFASLVDYTESALLDARQHFHEFVGIDLHPDSEGDEEPIEYPSSLPPKAQAGIFGELLSGLIAESYEFVGKHSWQVPIFLFRYHADVGEYMFALARDPDRAREVWGRFGNDFIGLSLDDNGAVDRIISGEAKWRKSLTKSVVDRLLLGDWEDDPESPGERVRSGQGIWFEVNRDFPVPSGARQLLNLLEECDPDQYANAILTLQQALTVANAQHIPRTDLVLIVGNSPKSREASEYNIEWKHIPEEYERENDLQVVEMYLNNGEKLIDKLFGSLWVSEETNAAE